MARRQSTTRPHTCPILTPQFHWNFNALAVESLSEQELVQVYQLFRFYDSSTIGDALPSINCRRFLQILRDGCLVAPPISSSSRASDGQKEHMNMNLLSVSAVEKVFAEAVMGKLRTYLDADGEPALTFHLFCGALMNCAITALPVYKSQPTAALKQLLSQYFSMLDQYAQDCKCKPRNPSTLLQHFSPEGLNALWCQDEAHGASIPSILCEPGERDRTEEPGQILEFHKREPFQQVISTFTLDMAHEARAKERSSEQYTIPAELEASFPPAKLRLVIERFQLFDVFDRGTLPRREILPFLTGLVKKLEITDMYEIIAVLLSGEQFSRYEPPTANTSGAYSDMNHQPVHPEISLVQILEAIHACRRSRSASSYANGTGAYSAASRKASNFVSYRSVRAPNGGAHDMDPSSSQPSGDNVEGAFPLDPTSSKDLSSSTKHNRRSKAHGSFAQHQLTGLKSNLSAKTSGSGSAGKRGKKSPATSHLRHKTSVVLKEDESEAAVAAAQAHPSMLSRRASTKKSESRLSLGDLSSGSNPTGGHDASQTGDSSFQELNSSVSLFRRSGSIRKYPQTTVIPIAAPIPNSDAGDATCRELDVNVSTSPCKVPTLHVQKSAAFRVFMLVGGEHDGAMCYIAELTLPGRHLEESKGIFYRHAPHEITEHSQVMPVQPNLESAILMLKKCIQKRLSEGFVPHPPSQLQRLDGMLSRIRQHNPHYASTFAGHSGEPPLCGSHDARQHKVDSPTILRRSLDRSGTYVRQSSTSDLLAGLSDSRLCHELKKKRESVKSSGHECTPRNDCMDPGRVIFDTATHQAAENTSWIHSMNESMNRQRKKEHDRRTLSASVSAPSLVQKRPQLSIVKKPHPGVQLDPIH